MDLEALLLLQQRCSSVAATLRRLSVKAATVKGLAWLRYRRRHGVIIMVMRGK